jgi:hypothetical protein
MKLQPKDSRELKYSEEFRFIDRIESRRYTFIGTIPKQKNFFVATDSLSAVVNAHNQVFVAADGLINRVEKDSKTLVAGDVFQFDDKNNAPRTFNCDNANDTFSYTNPNGSICNIHHRNVFIKAIPMKFQRKDSRELKPRDIFRVIPSEKELTRIFRAHDINHNNSFTYENPDGSLTSRGNGFVYVESIETVSKPVEKRTVLALKDSRILESGEEFRFLKTMDVNPCCFYCQDPKDEDRFVLGDDNGNIRMNEHTSVFIEVEAPIWELKDVQVHDVFQHPECQYPMTVRYIMPTGLLIVTFSKNGDTCAEAIDPAASGAKLLRKGCQK